MWKVVNNKLTHDDLPEPLTGNYIQPPYPPFWWYANDGKLTHDGLPEPISTIMSEPYPPFWWYVENGRLTHAGLPEKILVGAFLGCSNLKAAKIPESVKNIGSHAHRQQRQRHRSAGLFHLQGQQIYRNYYKIPDFHRGKSGDNP